MAIDEDQTSPANIIKWPFYASAIFVLGFVLFFALNRPADPPLDQWQLATCVLASALACILVFMPFLLQKFLELALSPSADREEQLVQKIYFELKELREDLGALGSKVDNVPAGVEKVVADSPGNDDAAFTETVKLGTEIDALRKEIGDRLDALRKPLEDAAVPPLDPALGVIPEVLDTIGARIDETLETVRSLKPKSRKRSRKKNKDEDEETEKQPVDEEGEEAETDSEKEPEAVDETSELAAVAESEQEVVEEEQEPATEEASGKEEEALAEPVEEGEPEEETQKEESPTEPDPEEASESTKAEEQTTEAVEETEPTEETPQEEVDPEEEEVPGTDAEPGEADETPETTGDSAGTDEEQTELELPDPAETLRKVDAILEETYPDLVTEDQDTGSTDEATETGGATSVIANVMIGIGNKPYLRGEGPGLSWDKGAPMNFVEIGKWAWSPQDKEAPLLVQLYRNDEEADPTGKHDVAPGQKLEITPDFGE